LEQVLSNVTLNVSSQKTMGANSIVFLRIRAWDGRSEKRAAFVRLLQVLHEK